MATVIAQQTLRTLTETTHTMNDVTRPYPGQRTDAAADLQAISARDPLACIGTDSDGTSPRARTLFVNCRRTRHTSPDVGRTHLDE